jgi:ATP-binding cassette subfamily B protein
VRLVVTSNAQEREADRFRTANAGFMKALMSMQIWSYLSGSAPGLVLSAGYVAVFVYGGQRVISNTLTLGTFIAFMAYYMRLFQPVQALMGLYSSIATVEVSLARVHQLLDARPDVVEAADPVRLTNVRGAVELERVSVDLGRGAVLSSVSFSVAAGQTIALVGPSGIGKSTIADLMVRLLDPDEGVVRLDGIDLRRVALEDLRRQVVLVDQEPILLHASIEDNIRYGRPEASSDQVATAASAAGLDDVTSRFPDRLQTVVGERGAALSAGERQRVAIARAFLANAAVLVLDEPTAALDPASERQILAGCERAMRGRTTILITHHLALAAAADRVLVLSDGVIVEQGSVEELQEKGGVFAALFAGQGSAAKVVRSSAGL